MCGVLWYSDLSPQHHAWRNSLVGVLNVNWLQAKLLETFSFCMQEMSFNYFDSDAAWNCLSELQSPTCVVVSVQIVVAISILLIWQYRICIKLGCINGILT